MTVKDILKDFKARQEQDSSRWETQQEEAVRRLEARVEKMNRCYQEIVLPAVRKVEKDLQEFGFWHKIQVALTTSLSTGRQNIGEVEFYFFPEKFQTTYHRQRLLDAAYKAFFQASGDHKTLIFTIRFPQRLPQKVSVQEEAHEVEAIDRKTVDAFLERFIKGALDAYQSDRLML